MSSRLGSGRKEAGASQRYVENTKIADALRMLPVFLTDIENWDAELLSSFVENEEYDIEAPKGNTAFASSKNLYVRGDFS